MTNQLPILTAKMADTSLSICRFKAKIKNEYSYLSNFYPRVANFNSSIPQPEHKEYLFEIDDLRFNSVEQYYQYQKFLIVEPCYAKYMIMIAPTAEVVKMISGKGYYVDYMYKVYKATTTPKTKVFLKKKFSEAVKTFYTKYALDVMRRALYHKFHDNPELHQALVSTYPHPLSEIGRMKKDFWAHTGSDALGLLLMELRLKFMENH